MIIETITVTTTPTSILDLLNTARGTTRTKSDAATSIIFRMDPASSSIVYVSEEDTDTPVILIDPANIQPFASYESFQLKFSLLSVDSGTVAVGIIASQA